MDVRLPRPLRRWREFVGEVGIIVLGALIALGAQQVVEANAIQALCRPLHQGKQNAQD